MGACPRHISAVSLLAVAFALAEPVLGQTDGQPVETLPGFKSNNVYHDFGSVDHVNVYSGDPGIVIPLGPEYPLSPGLTWQLRATYSSKFWTLCNDEGTGKTFAYINGYPTLGVGWGLHLGFVYKSDPSAVPPQGGVYVSPTTGRHDFFDDVTGTISKDGSGLRKSGNGLPQYTVEFPDGTSTYSGTNISAQGRTPKRRGSRTVRSRTASAPPTISATRSDTSTTILAGA
jgi:hypothetical protein